jgi:hypothetical protein
MIHSFYKTATLITAYDELDVQHTIERADFEAYVDRQQHRVVSYPNADCESTAEDMRLQSWDEYYSHERDALLDMQSYIDVRAAMVRIKEVNNMLSNIFQHI